MVSPVAAETQKESQGYHITGWKEVVVSVRDLDHYTGFFEQFKAWELVAQGDISKAQMTAWQQAPSSTAKYRLYGNAGTESGFIRLVQFDGVERELMRPDSQSWDTGGIFDINMRTRDLEALAKTLRAQGWYARSPITQFAFGPFIVKEWIAQNSDGLAVAFIQRVKPELEGWPHFKSLSRSFNSTQVVSDMPKSLKFYEDVLGFKRVIEHYGANKEPGENVLGLPHNFADKVPRSVYVLHPQGINDGSVELLAFDGAVGRDNSRLSKFPNIGIGVLAFPVVNIEALQSHFDRKGIRFVHRLINIDGKNKLVIEAPEGAWLEFYE